MYTALLLGLIPECSGICIAQLQVFFYSPIGDFPFFGFCKHSIKKINFCSSDLGLGVAECTMILILVPKG
jgi:hypothetical protein